MHIKRLTIWGISLLLLSLISLNIFAQTGSERVLTPGETIQGVIDEANAAQVYTFTAQAGDVISLSIESDIALTLLVTNAQGVNIAQARVQDEITGINDLAIPVAGVYFVTVFPINDTSGTFSLTYQNISSNTPEDTPVATTAAPPTTTITADTFTTSQVFLPSGMEVSLRWNTNDDLNLQVRDPNGGTLFWGSRTTAEGGSFGLDVNGLCEVINTPPNVETASWAGGSLPTGSYEILVYHRQACEEAVPVSFTIDVSVNGVALDPILGSIQAPVGDEATVFLASFTLREDGSAVIGRSGPYTDTRVLPISTQEILETPATPLTLGTPVQGVITNEQYFQTFTFSGQAGQNVTVSMRNERGNLDTLLLVLDSAGNIVADNDDIEPAVNTNSAATFRIPATDTFTIFASRYGKDVGGTEGVFTIEISGSELPEQIINRNLPSGDIEVTLVWNGTADLQLLVRDPFGNSVFDDTRRVASGGELVETGNINCVQSLNQPPVYYIYWPPNTLRIGAYEVEVWYQSDCGIPGPVDFQIYIVVSGQLIFTDTVSIDFNERYLTSFSIDQNNVASPSDAGIIQIAGGSVTLPYQQELASAISISGGDVFTGSITPSNKFDIYVFEGQIGDVVTIQMDATSQTLDTLLYLIDPSGAEIAFNDDAGDSTNSAITNLTLTQNGQYIILATHFGTIYGGTTGGYNLSLRIDR